MKSTRVLCLTVVVFLLLCPKVGSSLDGGRVIDAVMKQPIGGALVTLKDIVLRTDADGIFRIDGKGDRIGVRAHGYSRRWINANPSKGASQDIELVPFRPKALYLSFFGIGDRSLRESALDLIDKTELNALVIDVKGDRGMTPYHSAVPPTLGLGGEKITTIKDIKGLLLFLRNKGIYTIARIVAFKDNPLATGRPDLAVKTRSGAIWKDAKVWHGPIPSERRYGITILHSH
jgi:hypothetical protein